MQGLCLDNNERKEAMNDVQVDVPSIEVGWGRQIGFADIGKLPERILSNFKVR